MLGKISTKIITQKSNEYVCPKCNAKGKYGSGGQIEIATGNMVQYEFRCRNCGHTWGKNDYYRGQK